MPDYGFPAPVPGQIYTANGTITITTDGRTFSFSGGNPPFSHGPFNVDEYVPPEVVPPHLMITELALGTHHAPENHEWIELYLPPDASPVNLNSLYWTDLDEIQRAATSTVTIMPGDVVILHDAEGPSESNATGKGSNGWWDIYVENPSVATWGADDNQFVICSQNSLPPAPEKMIDAVVWSNDNGSMAADPISDGNYLIDLYQWGDPTAGVGLFSAANDRPAVCPIGNGYAQRIITIDSNSKADWQISTVNSEGTPPPTPTPIPTPPPQPPAVRLALNSSSLGEGDLLTVRVVVQPIGGKPFDGYAVITGKAGTFSIQSGNRLRRGIFPIVKDIRALPNGYSGMLLKMSIPSGVSGDYRVIAGLVDADGAVRSPGSAFAYDIVSLSVN